MPRTPQPQPTEPPRPLSRIAQARLEARRAAGKAAPEAIPLPAHLERPPSPLLASLAAYRPAHANKPQTHTPTAHDPRDLLNSALAPIPPQATGSSPPQAHEPSPEGWALHLTQNDRFVVSAALSYYARRCERDAKNPKSHPVLSRQELGMFAHIARRLEGSM